MSFKMREKVSARTNPWAKLVNHEIIIPLVSYNIKFVLQKLVQLEAQPTESVTHLSFCFEET